MICPNCYKETGAKNIKKCSHCNSDLIDNCKIKNVVVKNIFNEYDYDIDFYNKENVSILIGSNGFGKSTIFKIINFIYNPTIKNLDKIADIPFNECTIYFTNSAYITLERNNEEVNDYDLRKFNFTLKGKLTNASKELEINIYEHVISRKSLLPLKDIIEIVFSKEIPSLICDVFHLYGVYINVRRLEVSENNKIRMQLNKSKNKKENDLSEIFTYSKDITNLSVFNENIKNQISILEKYSKFNNSKNLTKYTIYFDKIKNNINLFCKIYNERNKASGKSIICNKEEGFVILLNNKIKVPLECLSDGEKNDFAIFYYLCCVLIKIDSDMLEEDNCLFLIDEPEVSLHIEWQKTWLDYVLEICKAKDIQVLVATHSPFIVNGHFNLYADKKVKEHETEEQ